jgi:hypothetical protein
MAPRLGDQPVTFSAQTLRAGLISKLQSPLTAGFLLYTRPSASWRNKAPQPPSSQPGPGAKEVGDQCDTREGRGG